MKKIFTLLLGAAAGFSAFAADTVITEPPAGATETLYCRNSVGIYYGVFGMLENLEFYGIAQPVYQEGNDVYIQNPVCPFQYDGYIKGTKTATGMQFSLPQPVYEYVGDNGKKETFYVDMFYYNINTGEYERDTDAGRTYDLELQPNGQYKFDYWAHHVETTWMGSLVYTDRLLGIVEGSSGEWMGFGELTCRLLPFDSTTPVPPAGMESKQYQFIYDGNGHNVRMGADGDDFYIQGMLEAQPDVWLKGTKEGNTITIPSNTYIGIAEGQTIFLTGGDKVFNSQSGAESMAAVDLELVYDEATDTYTPLNQIWLCNSPELDETYALFETAHFKPEPKVLSPEPAMSVINDWTNYDRTMEWAYAHVTLSALNVNGDVLPTDRLSYAFFIDDELYFLDPSDYRYIDGEMSWIPYNYTDMFDILAYARGKRTFYFYAEVDKTLALQMRYLDDEGKYHYSRKYIVTTPGNEHLGVGDIESLTELGSEDYDLTGRRVAPGQKGLVIRKVKMSDGSLKTMKVNNIR